MGALETLLMYGVIIAVMFVMGCSLYNTITADNDVTRYNLVWKGNRNA